MPENEWLIVIIGLEAIVMALLGARVLEWKDEAKFWKELYEKKRSVIK